MFLKNSKKNLLSVLLICSFSLSLFANPKGANVVSGDISIKQESATKLNIIQSTNKGIINWESFNIGKNEHTQFYQPNSNSITLNRVLSNDPSQLLGKLSANGNLLLVNQNGFYFGKNFQADVAGLVASTHDIKNEDFLNGNYNFSIAGNPNASIINEGTISAKDYGLVGFVAPYAHNRGTIFAKLGKVELASGKGFTLDLYGDDLIKLHVDEDYAQETYDLNGNKLNSFVENSGRIEAEGGYVALTSKTARDIVDSVVNQEGVIKTTGFLKKNGKIILTGSSKGIVSNSGTLDASNTEGDGGYIEITGEKIGLFEGSNIDTSGKTGGGTVLVGGDYLGGNASDETYKSLGIEKEQKEIRTATFVNMAKDVQIKANAIETGNGGKIVLWSDNTTRAYGNISANGGLYSGNGGFIEVSGKKSLDINNLNASVNSFNGKNGTILFDPNIVYIVAPNNPNILNTNYDLTNFRESDETYISSSLIEAYLNNGINVSISAKNNYNSGVCTPYSGGFTCTGSSGTFDSYIKIKDSIFKTSGDDATLKFISSVDISIDSNVDIISYKNKLNLVLDEGGEVLSNEDGHIYINSGTDIRTNGGTISPIVMTEEEATTWDFFNGTVHHPHLVLNGGTVSTDILFDGVPILGNENITKEEAVKYEKLITELEKDIQQYEDFKPFKDDGLGYLGNKFYSEDLAENLYKSKEKRIKQLNEIDNLNQSTGSDVYQKALVSLGFVTDIANSYKDTISDSNFANNIKNLDAVKKTADFINEKSQKFISMSKEEIFEYLNENPDLKQKILDFKIIIDEQSEDSEKWLKELKDKHPETYKNLIGTIVLVNEASDLNPAKGIAKNTIKNLDIKSNRDNITDSATKKPYDSNEVKASLEEKYGVEKISSSTLPDSPRYTITEKDGVKILINSNGDRAIKVEYKDALNPKKTKEVVIPYNKKGLPIFDSVSKFTTKIRKPNKEIKDLKSWEMREATRQLRADIKSGKVNENEFTSKQIEDIKAGKSTIDGYTWHHDANNNNLQLIPRNIHDSVKHVGETALKNNN